MAGVGASPQTSHFLFSVLTQANLTLVSLLSSILVSLFLSLSLLPNSALRKELEAGGSSFIEGSETGGNFIYIRLGGNKGGI